MGNQMLQHRQQPGSVVRQIGIEVPDVVGCTDGAAHRNTPRRPGGSAGWVLAMAVCKPEGKNRARVELRDRQAFTSRGAWIQFGSSQAPTNAVEKTI
jgi:hypothetical protein